jgi:hypothetical protein
VVVENEDRAMLRRQARKGSVKHVPILDGEHRIRPAGSFHRQGADARAPTSVSAQLVVAGIDQQPVKPRAESFRIAELRELAPGEEECLLDGILRSFRIAQDPVRDGVAHVAIEVDEFREGAVVAIPRSFDQSRPHVRHSSDARVGASPQ